MKRLALFIIIIQLISCGTPKYGLQYRLKKEESDFNSFKKEHFTHKELVNWKSYMSHSFLNYSPNDLEQQGYQDWQNKFFVSPMDSDENISLNDFVDKRIELLEERGLVSLDQTLINSEKYGESYSLVYSINWNSNTYKTICFFYKKEQQIYLVEYNSHADIYEKYLPDAKIMMDSFEIF